MADDCDWWRRNGQATRASDVPRKKMCQESVKDGGKTKRKEKREKARGGVWNGCCALSVVSLTNA